MVEGYPPDWAKVTLAVSPTGEFHAIDGDQEPGPEGSDMPYVGLERLKTVIALAKAFGERAAPAKLYLLFWDSGVARSLELLGVYSRTMLRSQAKVAFIVKHAKEKLVTGKFTDQEFLLDPNFLQTRCCASSHLPPDQACRGFRKGMNGRCVYCDHEEKCHPGPGATCEIGSGERG